MESGHSSAEDSLVRAAVEKELWELRRFEPDTLILGCTHFPYCKEALAAQTSLPLIDPAEEMIQLLIQ